VLDSGATGIPVDCRLPPVVGGDASRQPHGPAHPRGAVRARRGVCARLPVGARWPRDRDVPVHAPSRAMPCVVGAGRRPERAVRAAGFGPGAAPSEAPPPTTATPYPLRRP
jgi:hypothetical protein